MFGDLLDACFGIWYTATMREKLGFRDFEAVAKWRIVDVMHKLFARNRELHVYLPLAKGDQTKTHYMPLNILWRFSFPHDIDTAIETRVLNPFMILDTRNRHSSDDVLLLSTEYGHIECPVVDFKRWFSTDSSRAHLRFLKLVKGSMRQCVSFVQYNASTRECDVCVVRRNDGPKMITGTVDDFLAARNIYRMSRRQQQSSNHDSMDERTL